MTQTKPRTYLGFPVRDKDGGFTVLYRQDDGQLHHRLSPARSQAVCNYSPDGFNWGYGGAGPAQLALALLLEETTEDEATAFYQEFRREVISAIPMHLGWFMTSARIQRWLAKARASENSTYFAGKNP